MRLRALCTSDDRAGAARVDVGQVELPRRDAPPHLRGWRNAHARGRRAGGRRTVLGDQQPPGPKRVLACDTLLEDGGDERLHHPIGATEPKMRDQAVRGRDGRFGGREAGRIVVRAEPRGKPVDEFDGATSPCLAVDDAARRRGDACRDRTRRHQRRLPDGTVDNLVARVAGPPAQRRQRHRRIGDAF